MKTISTLQNSDTTSMKPKQSKQRITKYINKTQGQQSFFISPHMERWSIYSQAWNKGVDFNLILE